MATPAVCNPEPKRFNPDAAAEIPAENTAADISMALPLSCAEFTKSLAKALDVTVSSLANFLMDLLLISVVRSSIMACFSPSS